MPGLSAATLGKTALSARAVIDPGRGRYCHAVYSRRPRLRPGGPGWNGRSLYWMGRCQAWRNFGGETDPTQEAPGENPFTALLRQFRNGAGATFC